jgi:hypothetical protein
MATLVEKAGSSNLIPMAETYLDNGFNVLLLGLHGTGKTESIMQVARARGIKMKYYSCATLDPFTDLVGVPYPRVYCEDCGEFENRAEHRDLHPDCTAEIAEVLKMVRPRDVDEAEIIFFDEFNRADPKTMNAVFEIIQFRTINGEPLPNLRACWAAMNPPDEDYEVEKLDPALVDRFDLYIDIAPKPSISYMSQFMPEPIAKALKLWWDEHQKQIRDGKLDKKVDYVSPRRLLKIGLVWCATENSRSVNQSLPLGGHFEKTMLGDYLKSAQKQVEAERLGVTAAPESTAGGMGDRAAPQFIYQHANIKMREGEIATFLTENPQNLETHRKVANALRSGMGGGDLVRKTGRVLNALNPSMLEALITDFPVAKQSQMRSAFASLHKENQQFAKTLTRLHSVLAAGARGTSDFPMNL